MDPTIRRREHHMGESKEWWLKKVDQYNAVHGTSISTTLVEDWFNCPELMDSLDSYLQVQLQDVWTFAHDPAYANHRE